MTLKDLIRRAEATGKHFPSYDIPIRMDGYNIEVFFEPIGQSDLTYVINMSIQIKGEYTAPWQKQD